MSVPHGVDDLTLAVDEHLVDASSRVISRGSVDAAPRLSECALIFT